MTPQERRIACDLAREDLYTFTRWMFYQRRGYKWQRADHHRVICNALTRVFNGECRRLIITVPPRYGKTEIAVINFIAWALGKAPDSEFIHVSYSADLAALNAMQARELVQHDAYGEIFPATRIKQDSAARNHWRTTSGGVVYATGSGGTITGFGAGKARESFGGAIIVDDAAKADEALSDVKRASVIRFFQNTLESRKNDPKRTPIVIIGQRLHEEDLPGWLLDGGNGEEWEHINLPALREDGSALWPEKHTVEMLRTMERASPYTFSSQYQQRPTPAEGGLFKPDAIEIIDEAPDNVSLWVRAWDLAATEDDGDWTVGVLFGQTTDGHFIIRDVARVQGRPDEVERTICHTASVDGRMVRISLPQDPGQAGKFQAAYLVGKLPGYIVEATLESGDKIVRAEPCASQLNIGRVKMVRADWNRDFINELRNFPFGKYDDQVDALSRAFKYLCEKPAPMFINDRALAMSRVRTVSRGY